MHSNRIACTFLVLYLYLFKMSPIVRAADKLLIISYDGFRNEYFNRNITDYLNRLRCAGTHTKFMFNIFPTKTFPNHHTIATGQLADKHGVTANSVYDTRLNHSLTLEELFDYDDSIVPIWILNQKSGPNRYSGCMMWPGGEYPYQNETCHFWQSYNPQTQFRDRVDTILKWFMDADTPINLGMLYFEQPDSYAHVYGPDSKQVNDSIKELDDLTEYIDNRLRQFNLIDYVNVIYLSDHGMDTVLVRDIIDLNQFIKNDTYKYYGTSPVLQIVPNDLNDLDKIYNALRLAAQEHGNFTVYKNAELPGHWHFRIDRRVGPITVLANEGYGFHDLLEKVKEYQEKNLIPSGPIENHTLGVHGYDNAIMHMNSFFMATGPDIQRNKRIDPFSSIELYGIFCELLNIDPPKTTIVWDSTRMDDMINMSWYKYFKKLFGSNILIILGIVIIFLSIALVVVGIFGIGLGLLVRKPRGADISSLNEREKAVESEHLMMVHDSETED